MIGYLANLHPTLMNCNKLKQLLHSALNDIVINAQLAVKLDPELKMLQMEVMTNSDLFAPSIPPFELYKTKITTRRDKEKVETNVIGIKCALDKAKLMKEFYSQLASPVHYEKQIGVFIPMGVIHILGAPNYAKLICNNNSFLHSVTMIPLGNLQHATLNIPFSLNPSTDIKQTTLSNLISKFPWCISLKKL